MTQSSEPGFGMPGDFDVRYYAGVLWRARWVILTAAVVGLALGLLVAQLQIPEYQASAMLEIEPPTPVFMGVADALVGGGGYWQHMDYYNTQFKILQSKSVADAVIERLKLADRAPFKDAHDPAAVLLRHVKVAPIAESRLVLLQVTHPDPEQAALWANSISDVYIEQTLEGRVEAARKAYDWLQERLAATQQNMRESQDRLFKSYQTQDLYVPEGSVSAVSSSIAKLNSDFIDAQARRIALEAVFKQADEMRAQGQSLEALPQVSADGIIAGSNAQLAGLELELAKLREKYKQAHPEIQRVEVQTKEIRGRRSERIDEILTGLRAEFSQLQKREVELKQAIEGQKAQAATQSRKIAELEAIKKESESASSLYAVLLQKLNESDIAASIRNNNVRLVEKAVAPTSPAHPNRIRIAGIALVLGLVAGIGLILGRDYLDNTIKTPDDIERYLHLDLLAAVPRYDESSVHLVTEAYQNLRTALIFARKEETGQVVLVTSTAPMEGKTTTLVNLGKLLAASGEKTLVLDGDLRRAQLHSRLGIERVPGFTDYFAKHEDLDGLIRSTRIPNLFALTAGPLPPNPPALLGRKDLTDFLDHLKRHFEWILIDSPPLASVTDALLVARHADTALMVIQHNKVDKKLIKRQVASLQRATPTLLGVVLNSVDVKAQAYQYYYYQHTEYGPGSAQTKRGPRPVAAGKA